MTDIAFVAGAYLAALGALGVYAATLGRRLRAARSAQAAIERRREVEAEAEAEARTLPQVR
ncbi:MAG: hypothetical protein IVW53_14735 [Chloroflexi bacterium]|nr:hypothetical protein [Chloroflexota bacterium]MBF6606822.1 hypothetical protein [Chloroflexota bacterium]